MLQLQVGIATVLATLAGIAQHRVFEECLLEIVSYLIAYVV